MNPTILPLTEKRKQYELRGLALRDFAGVALERALDPFALARFAKLLVVDFNRVEGLSRGAREHLLGPAADEWSGGACATPLLNGWRIVILNPAHGVLRNRATLMEEIAHVFLGHRPGKLVPVADPKAPDKHSRRSGDAVKYELTSRSETAREYNKADEEAAYAIGAAALVPYAPLRSFVLAGKSSTEIGRHFGVSRQLVEYRIKVSHLWAEYRQKQTATEVRLVLA